MINLSYSSYCRCEVVSSPGELLYSYPWGGAGAAFGRVLPDQAGDTVVDDQSADHADDLEDEDDGPLVEDVHQVSTVHLVVPENVTGEACQACESI